MSTNDPDGFVETTAQTRELAREKAKALREQHRKQERRGRLLIKGGIVVVLLAIVAVVAVSILNTIKPPSPGPLNMLSDGIQIGANLVATPTAALQPGADPVATKPSAAGDVVEIQVYADYLSPDAGEFTTANAEQMTTWLNQGAATVEYHPISLLNSRSQGSQYSTRAANAAGCVANYDPNFFYAYNAALFTDQPDESSGGLSDDELLSRATAAGVTDASPVKDCITDIRFQNWVKESTDRALAGPLPTSDTLTAIADPLTVLVNGVQYTGAPGDQAAFAAFIVQAAGAQFNDDTAATATPTPAPTVTSEPTVTDTPTPTDSATPTP